MATPPPSQWGLPQVATLDARRGVYLAPAGLRGSDAVVLWHLCDGVGAVARWIGTPIGDEAVEGRSPWSIGMTLECAACRLAGVVTDGRWTDVSAEVGASRGLSGPSRRCSAGRWTSGAPGSGGP